MRKFFAVPYSWMVLILLLAFALRVFWADTRPLWYDDAFSVLLSERGIAAIASGTAADTMPPGYYALLFVWMNGFGQSPFAMRMLSVAMSMLIVVLAYVIAKRAFGGRAGIFAALFVALMPLQIYHAQELRMYTLLTLGGCIFLYGVLRLQMRQDARWRWNELALIALGAALALYAHNLAFVTLLAANFYFLYQRAWRKELQLLAGQFAGALLFAPWLLYVPTQLEKIQRAFWTQQPGLAEIVQMLLVWLTYLPLPPLFITVTLFVSVLILALAIWGLIKIARREKLPALGLLVCFAFAPPLLLFILSYLIRPVFVPRGAMVSATALVILLALVASRAPRAMRGAVIVGACALAILLLPFYYAIYGEWRRAPFAEADAFLRAQRRDGDIILHDNKLSFFPMHWYDRALPQAFLADPPLSDNDTLAPASQTAMQLFPVEMDAALRGTTRVWFVIFDTAVQEAGGAPLNLARLDARFQRLETFRYGDLDLVLYAVR